MREELEDAILAEAERKRQLSDLQRHELLANAENAIVAFRENLADLEPEELGRRERIVDRLSQAIAAAVMCLPDPPFASETVALAELREDGPLLHHPSLRAEPVAGMLSMWRAALDDYVEVDRFFEKGHRGERQPFAGCRLPGEVQILVLSLCEAWAANVDPALGIRSTGTNPLLRYLDMMLIEACGPLRPPMSTIRDFIRKRARSEIDCNLNEADGVDQMVLDAVLKSPRSSS